MERSHTAIRTEADRLKISGSKFSDAPYPAFSTAAMISAGSTLLKLFSAAFTAETCMRISGTDIVFLLHASASCINPYGVLFFAATLYTLKGVYYRHYF